MAITKVIAAKAPLITMSISMASPNISVRAKMYNGNEVAKTNRVANATPHSYLLMNIMRNATSINIKNTSWPRWNGNSSPVCSLTAATTVCTFVMASEAKFTGSLPYLLTTYSAARLMASAGTDRLHARCHHRLPDGIQHVLYVRSNRQSLRYHPMARRRAHRLEPDRALPAGRRLGIGSGQIP